MNEITCEECGGTSYTAASEPEDLAKLECPHCQSRGDNVQCPSCSIMFIPAIVTRQRLHIEQQDAELAEAYGQIAELKVKLFDKGVRV